MHIQQQRALSRLLQRRRGHCQWRQTRTRRLHGFVAPPPLLHYPTSRRMTRPPAAAGSASLRRKWFQAQRLAEGAATPTPAHRRRVKADAQGLAARPPGAKAFRHQPAPLPGNGLCPGKRKRNACQCSTALSRGQLRTNWRGSLWLCGRHGASEAWCQCGPQRLPQSRSWSQACTGPVRQVPTQLGSRLLERRGRPCQDLRQVRHRWHRQCMAKPRRRSSTPSPD